jgi:hypothetical protein
MNYFKIATMSVVLALPANISFAEKTDVPERFYEFGLTDDAKRKFIAITFDPEASDVDKSKSLSRLGDIAFEEQKVALALKTWKELLKSYPDSDEANLVMERINQIGQMVGETTGDTLNNAIASSYIRHGDWWSKDKKEMLTIDSSWIPHDKVSIGWYERVIEEFPDSAASVLAIKKKFYTVYGWEEPGKYGETYGVIGKKRRVTDLIAVYEALIVASPNDPDLQRFRYMIAQSYWNKKMFSETREWLQRIIDAGEGELGFYEDLAEWRMQKVEY